MSVFYTSHNTNKLLSTPLVGLYQINMHLMYTDQYNIAALQVSQENFITCDVSVNLNKVMTQKMIHNHVNTVKLYNMHFDVSPYKLHHNKMVTTKTLSM